MGGAMRRRHLDLMSYNLTAASMLLSKRCVYTEKKSQVSKHFPACVLLRTDGYIVCEEHEEILRTAWVEEQALQKQREKEVS